MFGFFLGLLELPLYASLSMASLLIVFSWKLAKWLLFRPSRPAPPRPSKTTRPVISAADILADFERNLAMAPQRKADGFYVVETEPLIKQVPAMQSVHKVESVLRHAIRDLHTAQIEIEQIATRVRGFTTHPGHFAAELEVAKPLLQSAMDRFQTRARIVSELETRLEEAYRSL